MAMNHRTFAASLALLALCNTSYALDWVELWAKPNGEITFLDLAGVRSTFENGAKTRIAFWERVVYSTERSKLRQIENRKRAGASTRGYLELHESRHYTEIDCINRRIRTLTVIDINNEGSALDSTTMTNESMTMQDKLWRQISPDSEGEDLHELLCSDKAKQPQ